MRNLSKKITSIVLSIILAFSVSQIVSLAAWDGTTISEPAIYDGVYQISTAEELAWFASEVNNGNNEINAIVTKNIDLGETSWVQIGKSNSFDGVFDGNNNTINFKMADISAIYGGLFNTVGEKGIVKNIKATGSMTIKGSRSGRNYHGGIAGWNKGSIINCNSSVDISVSGTIGTTNNAKYVGGIAGKNTGTVNNCIFSGTIYITSYAGGIVGENNGGNISESTNKGSVTSVNVSGYSGGIVAAVIASASDNIMTVSNCKNEGVVVGGTGDYGYAGGIIGQENVASKYNTYDSQPELTIDSCINIGTITAGNTNDIIAKSSENCKITIIEAAIGPSDEDIQRVKDAKASLEWFKLKPVYGVDNNVIDVLKEKLAENGYEDIDVTLTSTDDENCISSDGSITYFFADPDGWQAMWFNSVALTFKLNKNGAEEEYAVNATIYWDQNKVKDYLNENILSKVNEETIKGENTSLNEVTKDLVLPKVVDDKKWTLISWESSDTNTVFVSDSNQSTADTLFNPYIGDVMRSKEDKEVTLTATFEFNRTAYDESKIILTKTFNVTVKAVSFGIDKEMQQELNENYTEDKLLVFGTDTPIDSSSVTSDIQLAIPKNTGIENYDNFKFTAESSDPDVAVVTGFRVNIYRPLPGEAPKDVNISVIMTSKEFDISVKKDFTVTVMPLVQSEIDNEIALMEKVKTEYFNGINNGANKDSSHIKKNLSSFVEARFDENGNIIWAYDRKDAVGNGIIAVSIDENRPSELWDRFYSTNPSVIAYENLLVTRAEENTNVTVSSCLSSETYAKYAEKYPDNKDFAKLYRQKVSADLVVIGTKLKCEITSNDYHIENKVLNAEVNILNIIRIPLICTYSDEYSYAIWSSDNEKIKVDENGVITYKAYNAQSAEIKVTLYNEEGEILSEDIVTVNIRLSEFDFCNFIKALFNEIVDWFYKFIYSLSHNI